MKKRLGLIALLLLGLVMISGGYVLWSINQVPEFYSELMAQEIAPDVRKAEAKRFTQISSQLVSDLTQPQDDWVHEFTQRQVNSWFIEELGGKFAELLPEEAKDPRVKIVDGAILIGFKYSHSGWDGVVSLRVKPWVPEPDHLALQITSVKAGTLPIPMDSVLQDIKKGAESRGWKAEWRQSDNVDVLLIDFSQDGRKKSVIQSVTVQDGKVRVVGKHRAGQ